MSSSASSSSSDSSDAVFVEILASMGIKEYDTLVPVALNDYCRRFASELLCDAKDYASYANRAEITVEDINLALKLSDTRVMGVDPKDTIINNMKNEINKQDMSPLDAKAAITRYPIGSLLEQTQTYMPAWEANKNTLSESAASKSSNAAVVAANNNITLETSSGKFKGMSITGTQYAKKLDSTKGF